MRIERLSERAKTLLASRTEKVADEIVDLVRSNAELPPGADAATEFSAFVEHLRISVQAFVSTEIVSALVAALDLQDGTADLDPVRFERQVEVGLDGELTESYDDGLDPQERRDRRAAFLVAVIRSRNGNGLATEEVAYVEAVAAKGTGVSDYEVKALEHLLVRSTPGVAVMESDAGRAEILEREIAWARSTAAAIPQDHPALEGLDAAFLRELIARTDDGIVHQAVAELARLQARVAEYDASQEARRQARAIVGLLADGVQPSEIDIEPAELVVVHDVAESTGIVADHLRGDVARAWSRFEYEP